jgi:hypothetical protein
MALAIWRLQIPLPIGDLQIASPIEDCGLIGDCRLD